jgi:DNA polymerase I-like protein with 3'-5' exonuclease and polymerase domains
MNFPNLHLFDKFAIDTETTGLDWMKDSIFGVAISTPDGKDYYWDVRDTPETLLWLNSALKNFKGRVIGHNFKYDLHMFREANVTMLSKRVNGIVWDCTMIRASLINENRFTYSLDDLAKDYLNARKLDIYADLAEKFGGEPTRKEQMKNLYKAPASLVAPYAKRDTRLTLDLWEVQEKIIDRVSMHKVTELERDVMYVVQTMEAQGIRIDEKLVDIQIKKLNKIIPVKQQELNSFAKMIINPNPSKSIHDLFQPKWNAQEKCFITNDGTRIGTTQKGNPSIDSKALRAMTHPAAKMILDIRKLMKCRDTFLTKHIQNRLIKGRVFPTINQCKSDKGDAGVQGTVTGRLSYTEPALQQIPSRDKDIMEIVRKCFLPEEGQLWYRADYSQSDFRAFVHYTESKPLMEAYAKDPKTDFHQLTADVTGIPRDPRFAGDSNSKQIGLGLLFSMGEGKMAKEMGMPYYEEEVTFNDGETKMILRAGEEVTEIFKKFHEKVPGVKEFTKKATSVAKTRGYVISLMGRHLHFPDKRWTYRAVAYLCQSATAEFNKVKMVDTFNMIENTRSKILLTLHDELNFSSDDPVLMKKVEKEMSDFHSEKARLKLKVPMIAAMNSGKNWYEVK